MLGSGLSMSQSVSELPGVVLTPSHPGPVATRTKYSASALIAAFRPRKTMAELAEAVGKSAPHRVRVRIPAALG